MTNIIYNIYEKRKIETNENSLKKICWDKHSPYTLCHILNLRHHHLSSYCEPIEKNPTHIIYIMIYTICCYTPHIR